MTEISLNELKAYMITDKKINERAYELVSKFNLKGGEFDSVYIADGSDFIVIECGIMCRGEYIPTTHYLTPEEFCLENGKELFDERIKKEYASFNDRRNKDASLIISMENE